MKRKDLEDLGLEKDAVDKIMGWNGADIETEKVKTTKAEGERDNYKEQLDTATEQLEKLGDLKPEDVQNTIKQLQDDLKAKDDEYAAREAERLFDDSLDKAITAAGGRNAKAIRGMLDIETLKKSKDQTEDIKKALETVKESDAYLFGKNEPINNPVGGIGGAEISGMPDDLSAIRVAMGLPPEKK